MLTEKTMEKLRILAESAKYDVSCSSSGTVRKGKQGMVGNTVGGVGICHSFADLDILTMSNAMYQLPGIGVKSAVLIVNSRRFNRITSYHLSFLKPSRNALLPSNS